jgi:hypothetical protein
MLATYTELSLQLAICRMNLFPGNERIVPQVVKERCNGVGELRPAKHPRNFYNDRRRHFAALAMQPPTLHQIGSSCHPLTNGFQTENGIHIRMQLAQVSIGT